MDKNTWIGFGLIAAVIIGFSFLNRPSKEELAERKRVQDSIALVKQMEWETQQLSEKLAQELQTNQENEPSADQLTAVYGPFAPAAQGQEGMVVLENSLVRLGISRRGGDIAKAELKNYKAYGDTLNPLCLFQADENELDFTLVTNNGRILSTKNLYFEPVAQHNDTALSTLVMRLNTDIEECYIDFVYTLPADDYMVAMSIQPHNMHFALAQNMASLEMQWNQTIPQLEK